MCPAELRGTRKIRGGSSVITTRTTLPVLELEPAPPREGGEKQSGAHAPRAKQKSFVRMGIFMWCSLSGAAFVVSLRRLYTHIRNVYSKLGARDRSSAVQRARELRLLSSGRPRASSS